MIAILMTLTSANADQCAWIPKATAEAAMPFLQPGATWAQLCEPCGETAPVVRKVEAKPVIRPTSDPKLFEVVVDGHPIDLAYVFVVRQESDTKLGNLAFLTECPNTGVS